MLGAKIVLGHALGQLYGKALHVDNAIAVGVRPVDLEGGEHVQRARRGILALEHLERAPGTSKAETVSVC